MSSRQVDFHIFLRSEAPQTYAALEAIHFGLGVRAQVDAVAVNLAEALPAFSAAVRAHSGVQIHVVLELEFGGQLEVTDAAAVVA